MFWQYFHIKQSNTKHLPFLKAVSISYILLKARNGFFFSHAEHQIEAVLVQLGKGPPDVLHPQLGMTS